MRHRTSAAMAMLEITESDDLATLTKLDEQVLVDRLHERYDDDKIYTYIGDILVAVNPFRPLLIYENAYRLKYRAISRGDAPPHIFAVADQAYHLMSHTAKSQCCVVSGESGAGKTESAKFIIRHIIDLCPASTSGIVNLEKRILQVNPLLEAFGNAQTNMNDNSSRFGKYTELVFDSQGAVMGAYISEYLLEQSRVISQQEGEQNFHIFYYLFSHKEASKYMLDSPDSYSYLRNPEGLDEDTEGMLEEVMQALSDIGFSKEDEHMLFAVLSSVLHLGNIHFKAKDELDPANIHDSDRQLKIVCELLRIDEKQLRSALTCAVNVTRGEKYERRYTTQQAYDARDALAKALYGRIFSWLVVQLNKLLCPPSKEKQAKTATKPGDLLRTTIGILDIYGFENFGINSFEQLCINLANEQLQQFFNQHIFENELEEYRMQGIDGTNIKYIDNKPLLDMFLEKPIGLFSLLDEESHFPQATDQSLVDKYIRHFKDKKDFLPPVNNDSVFTIVHYAGKVEYDGFGFLEKNRDTLAPDVVQLLQQSSNSLVSDIFLAELSSTGNLKKARTSSQSGMGARRRGREQPEVNRTLNRTNKRSLTVGAQFRNSLSLLVSKMSACSPHFVRCIKPNTAQRDHCFTDEFVLKQLNYTGMLETTRIRKEGYSVRPTFEEFMQQFKILAYKAEAKVEPSAATCERILQTVGISDFLTGRTKLFLRYYHFDQLEYHLMERQRQAEVLQKCIRGYKARLAFRALKTRAAQQREMVTRFLTVVDEQMAKTSNKIVKLAKQDELRKSNEHERALAAERAAETQRQLAAERERLAQEEDSRRQAEKKAAEEQARAEAERAHEQAKLAAAEEERRIHEERERRRKEEEQLFNLERQRFAERQRQLDEQQRMLEQQREKQQVFFEQQHASHQEQLRQQQEAIRQQQAAIQEQLRRAEAAAAAAAQIDLSAIRRHPSMRWWLENEMPRGAAVDGKGCVRDWFHGVITRRDCERLLSTQPVGAFIIRVSESRFGYSLSVRVSDRVKHFMIEQSPTGHYCIAGNPYWASSLNHLIEYFHQETITESGEVLRVPCRGEFRDQLNSIIQSGK
eukprot:m.166155 g.166155  ORF g.166155 m.166155 type:complete len:1085 (-) comp10335_c1_seq19:233-3487(-)